MIMRKKMESEQYFALALLLAIPTIIFITMAIGSHFEGR